jgi:hypothetical protein
MALCPVDGYTAHPVMARTTTHCGTLWTLRRDGKTARTEIVEIEGVGLELRYTRNDKPFVRCIFTDGAELLREAAIERFELERKGWIAHPRAAGNAARPIRV